MSGNLPPVGMLSRVGPMPVSSLTIVTVTLDRGSVNGGKAVVVQRQLNLERFVRLHQCVAGDRNRDGFRGFVIEEEEP